MLKKLILKKVKFIKNVKYVYNIVFSLKKRCLSVIKIEDIYENKSAKGGLSAFLN